MTSAYLKTYCAWDTLSAPTAPTPHLSSTFRKASRSATKEKGSENFTEYLWCFDSDAGPSSQKFTSTAIISIER
jgi:hypothetical protein